VNRRLRLQARHLLANSNARTITGLAVPLGEAIDLGMDRLVRFAPNSVTFERDAIPLLAYHDPTRPVGRLVEFEWTESGLECTFRVSQTSEGDDLLQLANDGVLGLSVGVDVPDGLADDGEFLFVNSSSCFEISLTPVPMFAGASISQVTLSREGGTAMEDEEVTTIEFAEGDVVVNVGDSLGDAAQTIVDSMAGSGDAASEEAPAPATASLSRTIARTQPVARPVARQRLARPYPHLHGGRSNGHSFLRDLALQRGIISPRSEDAGYQERLSQQLRLAVTSADLPPVEPANDQVIGPPPDPANPLSGIVTTRPLPDNGGGPFYVLTQNNTGESNLSNPHVEGVEPILGDIGAWTRELVTPAGVSGKVAITREATLSSSPDMEALVFARMDTARRRAIETAFANSLGSVTLPPEQIKTVGGTNVGDDFQNIALDMLYSNDPGRFDTAIVSRNIFADLVNAKDSAGRPLYPILGASNANGTTAPNLRFVNVAGINVYPVAGLVDGGYMLDQQAVVSYLGSVLEFTFDYEVAWVRLGHFQYQAAAIVDKSGVIRLTYSAA